MIPKALKFATLSGIGPLRAGGWPGVRAGWLAAGVHPSQSQNSG